MTSTQTLAEKIKTLMNAGKSDMAAKLAEALVLENKKNPMAWLLLTQVHLRSTERFDLAERSAKKCISLAPKDHRGWLASALALERLGRFEEALGQIKKASKLTPNDPEIEFSHAQILLGLEQLERGHAILEKLHKQNPNHMETKYWLAQYSVRVGDIDSAKRHAEELRRDFPDAVRAYRILDNSDVWTPDHPSIQYLENDLVPRMRKEASRDLADALKTLAIAKNTHKEYVQSIELWKESKSNEGLIHDSKARTTFINSLCQNLTAADYLGAPGSHDETPLLLVGLPRCGSTLLTQILSSHTQIDSAGENPGLRLTMGKFGVKWKDASTQVRFVKTANSEIRESFARNYVDHLRQNGWNSKYVVDKLLHNFEQLGTLAAAMPKARIIHVLRDPMDQCVSCFTSPLNSFHDYTRDLKSLGEYYTKYRRLMDHWMSVLPNPILEVKYEDVVADTEGKAREVIDFLGLEWEPECLSFQDNSTQVRTISSWQVRQPIYTTSLERWRRYEPHLGPLKEALASFYPDGLD